MRIARITFRLSMNETIFMTPPPASLHAGVRFRYVALSSSPRRRLAIWILGQAPLVGHERPCVGCAERGVEQAQGIEVEEALSIAGDTGGG